MFHACSAYHGHCIQHTSDAERVDAAMQLEVNKYWSNTRYGNTATWEITYDDMVPVCLSSPIKQHTASRSAAQSSSPIFFTFSQNKNGLHYDTITIRTAQQHNSRQQTTMASSGSNNTENKDEILTYKPLAVDSAVSANPHIPSVTASAVLGESESVRKMAIGNQQHHAINVDCNCMCHDWSIDPLRCCIRACVL